MDQYIIVKVRDAKSKHFNPKTGESWWRPTGRVGLIRKAIHSISKDQDISLADMVTHSLSMTAAESDVVARVFEKAMERAKSYR